MDNVFLAIPTYDHSIMVQTAQAAYTTPSAARKVIACTNAGSLLPSNHNALYTMALNERESAGIGWFAMLHADVVPEEWWVDKLIAEAEEHKADMMSAVVALKDDRGISSTAIAGNDYWRQFGRLTMHQLHAEGFPQTFGMREACESLKRLDGPLRVPNCPLSRLLLNTGCCVLRMSHEWVEKLYFRQLNKIERLPNGKFQAYDFSEDWWFSRLVESFGGLCMATTKVRTTHGLFRFPNDKAWGRVMNDCDESRLLP
jgi:hypothetical protein